MVTLSNSIIYCETKIIIYCVIYGYETINENIDYDTLIFN